MEVSHKKPITLKNNTKYFNPETSAVKVHFASSDSYQSRQIKIEGYESRLYWQYRYCDEHDGQTFFYTLTYNDKAVPKMYNTNCFDYEDLRDLLTGGFRKMLLRKYGTKFKYFVGAELGDGKGERGLHNNPHYHVLFFLENANNPRFPYVKISPEDFRHLIRFYWQGFDEDEDKKHNIWHDYRDAKYGIAREGEPEGVPQPVLGKVVDFRACCYCAKYVCKDVKLKQTESSVEIYSRFTHKNIYKGSNESYKDFFYDFIKPEFNIPLNPKRTEWCYTDEQLIERLIPDYFDLGDGLRVEYDEEQIPICAREIIYEYKLWDNYYKYVYDKVSEMVYQDLLTWRNRYCNKCRISHGVGDYALEHIDDVMNPCIQYPKKDGMKNRPLCMYYFRKLFTEVIIDKKGSPIRILNELGRTYKLSKLGERLEKKENEISSSFNLLLSNPILFDKMRESDVNTEVFYEYSEFLQRWNYLLEENNNNIKEIYERYAQYKLVYEDRFFAFEGEGRYDVSGFCPIDVYRDYERFLIPSIYSVSRSDVRIDTFLKNSDTVYLSYSEHPYFLRYLGIFRVFDLLSDYFFVKGDDKSQREAEEIAATKRFHSKQKVKEFYSKFQNFSN